MEYVSPTRASLAGHRSRLGLPAAIIACLIPLTSWGQGAIPRPGDQRLDLPAFPSEEPPPEPVMPAPAPAPAVTQPPAERPAVPPELRICVKSYRIVGNTVFSEEELRTMVAPYLGCNMTTELLEELRYQLTLHYVNKKYTTSGVIIPDQYPEDGVVTLWFVEGILPADKINISGEQRLRERYIRSRVALGTGPPLNVDTLKERLQLLNQNPLISQLDGQLAPGTKRGESLLNLNVKERRPYQIGFDFDNHRTPSVGAKQGGVRVEHGNLTGWGDKLTLGYQKTEGVDDWTGSYSIPITARDTTLGFEYEWVDSDVVFPNEFKDLDIKTKFQQAIIRLQHPFKKTFTRTINGIIRLEKRENKTYLLGERFSFSEGAQSGKSQVSVVRLVGDWLERTEKEVFAARSTFSLGLDILGATSNDDGPDGQFFTWLGQFQYARRFNMFSAPDNQVIFRTDVQIATDPLLSMEKFGVGGPSSVRGYITNQLVRDSGLASSLELRLPVLRRSGGGSIVQLAVFGDYGRSWNYRGPELDLKNIGSVGLGLLVQPIRNLQGSLYYGYQLNEVDNPGNAFEDGSLNFQLSYQAF